MSQKDLVFISFFAGILFSWFSIMAFLRFFKYRHVLLKYRIGDLVRVGDCVGRIQKIHLAVDEWAPLPDYEVKYEIDTGYRTLCQTAEYIDDRLTENEYATIKTYMYQQMYQKISPSGRADDKPQT